MKVRFKEPISEVWKIAQSIPKIEGVQNFSFNDIFEESSNNMEEVIREVIRLWENEYFVRFDSPYSDNISIDEKIFGVHYHHLTFEKDYEVLAIEVDWYRLLTDQDSKPYGNDPILYNPNQFELIDKSEPHFWNISIDEDGQRSCYPPFWDKEGFFEDYHDGIIEVGSKFWKDIKKYYPETCEERDIKS